MLDLNFIRQHPREVAENARRKGVRVGMDEILRLDAEHRAVMRELETSRAEQKASSKGKPSAAHLSRLRRLADAITQLRERERATHAQLAALLLQVPNLASADTPVGADARGNQVLREVGERPSFTFTPKPHWELGVALGVLETEQAAAVAGTRFAYLKGPLALLQFALLQHAFAVTTSQQKLQQIIAAAGLTVPAKPFVPVVPPVFVRPEVFGQMARLEPREERYYIPSDDVYLAGSAEHTLGPLHRGEIIPADALPVRYVGYSTCFRREAGSYGKDVRGMIRLHQFDKLEFESFTLPEYATAEQDFLVAVQEHLLQTLELPYRVVQICTGDMGLPDARQIDLETWMPGLGEYKETHTADMNTDFQARRLQTQVRRPDGSITFAHMNDATVFAMGRTLVAIMENYQQADGNVRVPKVLQPFLPGSLSLLKA